MSDASRFEDHCWKDLYSDDVYRIYEPYRRDTQVKGRAALLLIDLYNLCYQGGNRPVADLVDEYPSTCGEHAWTALPPTQALLGHARQLNLPIFYSSKDTRNQAGQVTISATNRQHGKNRTADAYEINPAVGPQTGDCMIFKQRASCFFGTPLISYLTQLNIETLIVCGESTSGCVRASVLDSYSYGFHTVVAEDCVFDRNTISHQANLFDMHHKYADVMASEEIIAQLPS